MQLEINNKYIFNVENNIDNVRYVLDKMIGGIDICFVDPGLFPKISSWIENYRERYKNHDNSKIVLEKLDFFDDYINGYERREEITEILTQRSSRPAKKPPALTEQQVLAEVNLIMNKGHIREYNEREMNLVVAGLRKRRGELVEEGRYLEAEKANNYAKKIINHEQLTAVEVMQVEKCELIQQSIEEEKEKLIAKKLRWEKLHKNMKISANRELKEMKHQHKNELNKLISLKNDIPRPAYNKFSPELLNMRKREQAMIRSRRFAEAGQIKEIADEMERKETQINNKRWNDKIDFRIKNLLRSQKKQLDGRKLYWKNEENEMVNQANKEIANAERLINHMMHNFDEAKAAMELATSLKEGSRKEMNKTAQKLPSLLDNPKEIERVRTATHGQRRILNRKIYTRRAKTAMSNSPRMKPR
ncbi:hypothetical protein TRFO_25285 [Tritrichomonas foetus]|uniref:Uncharacterized protein n=1 Tax=Tritrichomonas foetus TaxID=1144522 RepID=A0A1J4K5E4_9EUKA|nr:hypothetical protein TRFO_25285 [Tritrichomonas foetus]|eukprot:OHT06615.1 hypothetical protein TRFO_25285 [Tritrichomonas foetus]